MEIRQKYLPIPSERRSGIAIQKITYIVCHDTGNDGATAIQNVNYYIKSANDIQASAHAFVDDLGVIECIPNHEKSWHVRYNAGIAPNLIGNFANDHSIGIELCYSTRGNFDSLRAYQNYVTYIAGLMKTYNLKSSDLYQHAQLDPTRRTDPINAFSKINKTWDNFLQDIEVELQTKQINKNMQTILRVLSIVALETQTQIFYVVDIVIDGETEQDTFGSWIVEGHGFDIPKAVEYAKTKCPETTEVVTYVVEK